ncbi:hypothetical protein [Pseudomonas sp. PL-6]
MNKPQRGRQNRPTRGEVAAAWERLRAAADQGDIQAAALLVALAENKPLFGTAGVHA